MAKFNFNLQSVLNIKAKLEDQKKMEFGKAMQALEDVNRILKKLQDELAVLVNDFNDKNGRKVTAYTLILMNKSIKYYNDEIARQKVVVKKSAEKVEQVRGELAQIVKEKKTYEILKERAYEAYVLEEKSNENKLLDEIVSYKYSQ